MNTFIFFKINYIYIYIPHSKNKSTKAKNEEKQCLNLIRSHNDDGHVHVLNCTSAKVLNA